MNTANFAKLPLLTAEHFRIAFLTHHFFQMQEARSENQTLRTLCRAAGIDPEKVLRGTKNPHEN